MRPTYTPGPWKFDPEDDSIVGKDESLSIATIDHIDGGGEKGFNFGQTSSANARLIAAAPDLLDALRITRGNIASLGPAGALTPYTSYQEWLAMVDAAIAKATVGQP